MKQFVQITLVYSLMLIGLSFSATAQTTYMVSGQVTDAATGEGIPFASIAVKGKTSGTTSDGNGRYTLRLTQFADSLLVLSLGYKTGSYPILALPAQTINAALTAAATRLQEVKVYTKGGDPAYRIMREAVRRRDQYNPARLSAYQYESYTKIEGYINNFAQKRKKNRRPGPISRFLGKLPAVVDENGKPAVPVFISETASTFYARIDPQKTKEYVQKSHVTGVGISDGGLIAQLTGASFQQYNFYRPSLSILQKDIPSPISSQWETVYRFRLKDTIVLNNAVCYEIEFTPKRASDLAFARLGRYAPDGTGAD